MHLDEQQQQQRLSAVVVFGQRQQVVEDHEQRAPEALLDAPGRGRDLFLENIDRGRRHFREYIKKIMARLEAHGKVMLNLRDGEEKGRRGGGRVKRNNREWFGLL